MTVAGTRERGPAVREALAPPVAVTGNEAVAVAVRQARPGVIAAYPITPQTDIVQYLAHFCREGMLKAVFLPVESEHSALSAVIGAAAAGVRAVSATSSQGLLHMAELLPIASGMRLPVLLAVVNRALSAPLNIHCDHSDSLFVRDAGWLQLYCASVQEVYDTVLLSLRWAEDPRVRLPVMVCQDGFFLSHCAENLEVLPDEEVSSFLGDYRPEVSLLDSEHPASFGAMDLQDWYLEHRQEVSSAMRRAFGVYLEAAEEFFRLTGRYWPPVETYALDDARFGVVVMGTAAGTVRAAIERMRKRGLLVGLLRVRLYRPFPRELLAGFLEPLEGVAVLDRADTLSGFGGPLFLEVAASLYGARRHPRLGGFVYGLGGRELRPEEVERAVEEVRRGEVFSGRYLGLRGAARRYPGPGGR